MRLPVAIALLLAYTTLLATELRWKVHYSLHGEHDAIVPAESSAQARREVIFMFPGAVVTGVSRVKYSKNHNLWDRFGLTTTIC